MTKVRYRNRCESVRDSLGDYLDGNLSKALRGPLLAHLNRCPDCRRAMDREKELFSMLGDLEQFPVPDGFTESVLASALPRVRIQEATRPKVRHGRLAWFSLPVALLLLVMMLGQVFTIYDSTPDYLRETVGRTLVEGGRDIPQIVQTLHDVQGQTRQFIQPVLIKIENIVQFERVFRSVLPTSTIALILLVAITPVVLVFTIYRLRIKGVLSNVLVSL
ncbi:MAG: hypothetical protein GY835_00370 [bacterium]|nr:hypothetical protein [bacterium]